MHKVRRSVAASSFRKFVQPVEAMERRRLLSVAVNSGVLTLTGSGNADTYVLTQSGSNVRVVENGGSPQDFSAVTGILANLGGGNDSISVDDALTINATLNGGDGNDTLTGGGGDDTLNGDAGDDLLDGRSGQDAYNGGTGVDTASYASRNIAITANIYLQFLTDDDGNGELNTQGFAATVGPDPATDEGDGGTGMEHIIGTSLNDTLTTSISVNYISFHTTPFSPTIILEGGGGNDTLAVTGGAPAHTSPFPLTSLFGGDGNDTITGGFGADTIDGGLGNDSIDGGGGNDTVTYFLRSTPITASLTATVTSGTAYHITGSGGAAGETDTFANVDTLTGSSGNDTLSAGAAGPGSPNTLPTSAIIRLNGSDGSDTLSVGTLIVGGGPGDFPPVIADGGPGSDLLRQELGLPTTATLLGGEGEDLFENLNDDSYPTIDGGPGDDWFRLSAAGNRTYTMGPGLEKLTLDGSANYTIAGNDLDNDIEAALNSNITVDARGGNDTVHLLGRGRYSVTAGDGNDTVLINENGDINDIGTGRANVDGGSGDDLIVINGGTDTVHGGAGDDRIYAGVGDDRVFGDDGDDRLNGDGGKDTIYGGDGNDRVYGNSGADRLFGEVGVDRLYGGNKNDYLDGGAGGDYVKGDEDVDTAKRDKKDRRYESIEIFV